MKVLSCSVFVFLLFFTKVSIAQTTTVSGIISLPAGIVAGSDGVEIQLSGIFAEFSTSLDEQTIRISPGQSSSNYSLTFAIDNQGIEFECDDCFALGVTTRGQWNEIDGVSGSFRATRYALGTNNNVDISLGLATTFTGRVLFPNNFVADGDELISVSFVGENNSPSQTFSDFDVLDAGATSFDFSIGVPSNLTRGWTLRALCIRGCNENLLFSDSNLAPSATDSNFPTTINGDPTSLDPNQAFIFPSNQDYSDISITLRGTNVVITPILYLLLNEEN